MARRCGLTDAQRARLLEVAFARDAIPSAKEIRLLRARLRRIFPSDKEISWRRRALPTGQQLADELHIPLWAVWYYTHLLRKESGAPPGSVVREQLLATLEAAARV